MTTKTVAVEEYADGSKTTSTTEKTTTETADSKKETKTKKGEGSKTPEKVKPKKKPVSDESEDEGIGTEGQKEALRAHNRYRARHGAPPLELCQNVMMSSQFSNSNSFEHNHNNDC